MNNDLKFPAVILAGGAADPDMAEKYSVENRAAVPIAGKMMIQYIADALSASRYVTDVHVVGNIKCEGASVIVPPTGSLIENLIAGVKSCSGDSPDRLVLVATSDIPLITSAAVDDLIERCNEPGTDFFYPVITKEANEKRFPGMKRTYARLAEGTFTGGNIMVMRSGFVMQNADLIRNIFDARKSVIKLAGLIGFPTLMRAVIAQTVWPGAAGLPVLEKTVGRMLNARIKAVQTPYPEIGADVDKMEHIAFAEAALRR
jgi:molybdopterin-guanine dinucleotide biosynthesis protein A